MTDFASSYQNSIEAARLARARGDLPAAEESLRSAVRSAELRDDAHHQLVAALIQLGELQRDGGKHAEAETTLRQALEDGERFLGSDDLGLLPVLTSLAAIRIARGAPQEAAPLLVRALSIGELKLGSGHPDLGGLLNELSRLYLRQSSHSLAEPLLIRLHAI